MKKNTILLIVGLVMLGFFMGWLPALYSVDNDSSGNWFFDDDEQAFFSTNTDDSSGYFSAKYVMCDYPDVGTCITYYGENLVTYEQYSFNGVYPHITDNGNAYSVTYDFQSCKSTPCVYSETAAGPDPDSRYGDRYEEESVGETMEVVGQDFSGAVKSFNIKEKQDIKTTDNPFMKASKSISNFFNALFGWLF